MRQRHSAMVLGGLLSAILIGMAACQGSPTPTPTSPATTPTATATPRAAPIAQATPTPVPQASPTPVPAPPTPVPTPEPVTSEIRAFTFQDLIVRIGTTVTWLNRDSAAHTVTSDTGAWDTESIAQNRSASHTFTEPGTYQFHCAFHPSMTATVRVLAVGEEPPAPTPTPRPSPSPTPSPTPTATPIPSLTPRPVVHTGINGFAFQQDLSVPLGTIIEWTNGDTVSHTVTSGTPGSPNGLWDSGSLILGKSFHYTFTEAGVFPYYCAIHTYMTGAVTVIDG